MIATEQKQFEEVLKFLGSDQKVFIVGCGACATSMHTGGEPEVLELKGKLEKAGKQVTGWVVVEEPCDERLVKREFRAHKTEAEAADSVIVMACGLGVQSVATSIDKPTHPALNTIFMAHIVRLGIADERCQACGECVVDQYGALCPFTLCPKGLLNGPCGGSSRKGCEVDTSKPCGWVMIYDQVKKFNRLKDITDIQPAKDQSKIVRPRSFDRTGKASA